MTLVELVLFLLAVVAVMYFLKPLQKRIEAYLYKKLRRGRPDTRDVIDITDYTKKDEPK